jgi:transcriptional regulator with XRE-family HTH domain
VHRIAEELLCRKVNALIKQRSWSQVQFLECLRRIGYKRSQAWASRKLTGLQPFRVQELDMLAAVFNITIPELFFDEYGQWDRRSGSDRRKGERRQRRQTIYDAKIEITPTVARLSFPAPNTEEG